MVTGNNSVVQIKQINILLNHLGKSQLAWEVCQNVYQYNKDNLSSITLFFEECKPTIFPLVTASMNAGKIYSAHADKETLFIATNLNTAKIITKLPKPGRKIFYVWNLEFLENKDFIENIKIYRNIELFTRSISYSEAINNYCGIKPKIMPHFNIEGFYESN